MLISNYIETSSSDETWKFKNEVYFRRCDGRPTLIMHSTVDFTAHDFYEDNHVKINKFYLTEDDVKLLKEKCEDLKEMMRGDTCFINIPLSKQNLFFEHIFINNVQLKIELPQTDLNIDVIFFDSSEEFNEFIKTVNEL
jgi:hypothetical protein